MFSCIRKPTTACSTFPQQTPGLFLRSSVGSQCKQPWRALDAGKQVHGRAHWRQPGVGTPLIPGRAAGLLDHPTHTQHGIWAASSPPTMHSR